MGLTVLICGDRKWTDRGLLFRILDRLPQTGLRVIEGGATGADRLAREWTLSRKAQCIEMAAEWDKYGPQAGPIRNIAMLDLHPDLVVAFHDHIDTSKGTAHCLREAKARKIPTRLVTHASLTW